MTFLACHQRPWLAFHPYEVIGEEVRNQQNRSSQTIKPPITLRHLPHPYHTYPPHHHQPASCTIITTTIAAKPSVQNTVQLEIRLTGHFLHYKLINNQWSMWSILAAGQKPRSFTPLVLLPLQIISFHFILPPHNWDDGQAAVNPPNNSCWAPALDITHPLCLPFDRHFENGLNLMIW